MSKVLKEELTLSIHQITLWMDSTTILAWLYSDSCKFKVFVGTRIAEIQDLTARESWRYEDFANNPADDITCGKHLQDLTASSRWFQGPTFLQRSSDQWPQLQHMPAISTDCKEIKTPLSVAPALPTIPHMEQFKTWRELTAATAQSQQGAANTRPTADNYKEAENLLLQREQQECFPDDWQQLKTGKPLSGSSRLIIFNRLKGNNHGNSTY